MCLLVVLHDQFGRSFYRHSLPILEDCVDETFADVAERVVAQQLFHTGFQVPSL
jgi:hypothetical protein